MSGGAAVDRILRYADAARWEDASPVDGLREESAATFPQRPGSLNPLIGPANAEPEQREDAFQLRVQAPSGAEGLPVLVFLPGGGFMTGGGTVRWFDAARFVERERLVLVTVSTRIGALGHLGPEASAHESQRPLRDALAALRWVRGHIAELGGDPERVTLGGDSAGAWQAFALAAMPEASGLFRRLLLLSLPREHPLDAEGLSARRSYVVEALAAGSAGVASGDVDTALAQAPAEAFLDAQSGLAAAFRGRGMPLMSAAGGSLPSWLHEYERSAAALHVESLALVATADEAAAFLLGAPAGAFGEDEARALVAARFARPEAALAWMAQERPGADAKTRVVQAMTLDQFRLAHLELARAAHAAGLRVDVALLELLSGLPGAGSPHCLPLPLLFGERASWADAPMLEGIDPLDFARASAALQAWAGGVVREGAAIVDGRLAAPYAHAEPRRVVIDGSGARMASAAAETALLG